MPLNDLEVEEMLAQKLGFGTDEKSVLRSSLCVVREREILDRKAGDVYLSIL